MYVENYYILQKENKVFHNNCVQSSKPNKNLSIINFAYIVCMIYIIFLPFIIYTTINSLYRIENKYEV